MVKAAKGEEDDPELKTLYLAIGQKIKAIRLQRNYSQKELAARTEMKQPYLAEIELFGVNLSLRLLKRISTALDVTLRDLLPGSDDSEDCEASFRTLRAEMSETLQLFESQYAKVLALVDRADQLGKRCEEANGHMTSPPSLARKAPRQ
jgi:transcriptional regulator with XRE-family HTH domain